MKILLTGVPKSGKSTLLASLMADIVDRRGITAPEVRVNGERIGFDIQDDDGKVTPLARAGEVTPNPVGRYFVNIESLDEFVEQLFTYDSQQLLYIDEIGQMQIYSKRFRQLVAGYLDAPNDFIGTVSCVYQDGLIDAVKQRDDVMLCTVTPDNRHELKIVLEEALKNRQTFNSLSLPRQALVLSLAREYFRDRAFTSAKKLFKNALSYVVEEKVKKTSGGFVVQGRTNEHHVRQDGQSMQCDCEFFLGTGAFTGSAGECSHIQAVKLLSA